MKKIFLVFIISISTLFGMKSVDIDQFKSIKAFQGKGFEIVKAVKLKDGNFLVHLIAKGKEKFVGIDVFVSSDLSFITIGKTVDAKTNKPVFVELDKNNLEVIKRFKDSYKLTSFDTDKQKAPIVYGKSDASKEFFLFTDPDCPYCKRFEMNIKNRGLRDDVKLFVFPMHLNIRGHKKKPIEFVLSLSPTDRAQAFSNYILGDTKEYDLFESSDTSKAKLKEWLDESESLAKSYNVRGTPSVVDKYGHTLKNTSVLFK